MAMTESGILEVILDRIHPHGEQISTVNEELLNVLVDITSRRDVDFLTSTSAPTVVDGTTSFSKPTGWKRIIGIEVADHGMLERISFDLYQNRYNYYESLEGEPHDFAEYGDNIYIWPTADTTYTTTLYYAYIHPRSTDTIYLDDNLREAVYSGILANLYRGRLSSLEGAINKAEYYQQIHEREIQAQKPNYRNWQPRNTKYLGA